MVYYKDQEIPIDDFYFLKNKMAFIVCPDFKDKTLAKAYEDLFTETDSLKVSDITYGYGNIKDSLGNTLDYRKLEYMHQYREFFTQEIIPQENEVTEEQRFMIKMKPLDSPLQPINSGKMKNTYWKIRHCRPYPTKKPPSKTS